MITRCLGCGLPQQACCCDQIQMATSAVSIALVLHENEPQRPTTTSYLIQKVLPQSSHVIWQRTTQPDTLIEQINAPETQAWLLFPADRPELRQRQREYTPLSIHKQATKNEQDHALSKQRQLIIVPDGTWKEVRKIVRKSPWLDKLPILAFDPATPSRYDLRRNPDPDHLCTAETVAALLRLCGETTAADQLDLALDAFLAAYKGFKSNPGRDERSV